MTDDIIVGASASRISAVWRCLGLLSLSLSLVSASLLVLQQLYGLTLHGCGPSSACASLSNGPWGTLAGWPLSYVGLAYFCAISVGWWLSSGGVTWGFRSVVGAGVAVSLGLTIVMIAEQHFCLYCLLAHLGNLLFAIIVFFSSSQSQFQTKLLAVPAGVFLFVIASLGLAQQNVEKVVAEKSSAETSDTISDVVKAAKKPAANEEGVLKARWRKGPEIARLRIVMWGDYQCKDCRNAESELDAFRDESLSVSFLHFPLCKDCNRIIKHPRFHDNACRAAYAAEAAGILGGNEGFWRMHDWLIERKGLFDKEQLRDVLPRLGFDDHKTFFDTMMGKRVAKTIRSDIERAVELGIDGTPLVFINGVELKSADVEGNVTVAIEELLKKDLPPRSPHGDRPQGRIARLVERWRDQETIAFPPNLTGGRIGPAEADRELVLIIDYANPYSIGMNQLARTLVEERTDCAYRVVVYPLSKELNPKFSGWKADFYGPSTEMARLVMAASELGGQDAFWEMHEWILAHQENFDEDAAIAAAAHFGLDSDKLRNKSLSDSVDEQLRSNISVVEKVGISWASQLYVDGKHVTAMIPTRPLIESILEDKSSGSSQ